MTNAFLLSPGSRGNKTKELSAHKKILVKSFTRLILVYKTVNLDNTKPTSNDAGILPEGLLLPFELIAERLSEVDEFIRRQARTFDPGVEGYISYVCEISGKRIRPALAILAGGACGKTDQGQIKIGAVIERVHLATLVHDDIMDGAELRRDMPTVSAKWGSTLSVLLGDCLFARALEMAAGFKDNAISQRVSAAASAVCQGEILQTQRRFDLNLTRREYFRMIEMKTGSLFATATELGARIAGADEQTQENLRNFGMKVGIAYQIYDDCLDLVGKEELAGKTLRTDLAKGKLTLPVLNLIASATESQREKLNKHLLLMEPIDVATLAGIADYDGSIDQATETGKEILAQATLHLDNLPESPYCSALIQVTSYLDSLLDTCLS